MENNASKKIGVATIISVIACVVLIPIVIVNTIMIIKTYTTPDHIPDVFGISPVVVLSGSMSPTFEAEALIFIKDVDNQALKEGDVICFLQGKTAITHRIEEVSQIDGELRYITKGDANNAVDRLPVAPQQIEGVYIGHIGALGGFAMFMQSTTGMILFIVCPILLYLVYDMFKRRKESQMEKSKTAELEAELAKLKAGKKD